MPRIGDVVAVRNVVYPKDILPALVKPHRARLRVERVFCDRLFVRDIGSETTTQPAFLIPLGYVNSTVDPTTGAKMDHPVAEEATTEKTGEVDARQRDSLLYGSEHRRRSLTSSFTPGTRILL
ncbi:unnamed protein product, partial [Amoebophrya sp. A120]|eukprot:GSA120T00005414001.1